MIRPKTEEEIELLRDNGLLVSKTLAEVGKAVAPGVTTAELNRVAETFIRDNGAIPSFLGFEGFPASICASVNDVVVHGFPSDYVLKEGDIVSCDIGTLYKGYNGDSCYTFPVGEVDAKTRKLLDVTKASLYKGGGASVCAIKNGKSYDTSMGYTPLEGLIMETRCGDIDPAVILKIMKLESYTIEEMDDLLNKKSGRIGFTGIGDFRLMKDAALEGNEDAILMRKMQTQRIKKYIGAYMAELNHVDAVVFTGGIMENNDDEIENVISNMEQLGLELDKERNKKAFRGEGLISKDSSKIKIYLIPTNEELEIAKQTVALVKEM